jgi:hypothetical protein
MKTLTKTPTPETVEEALALCVTLDVEAKEVGMRTCVRAARARESLDRPHGFWGSSPSKLEILFRGLSHVCCGCHRVGSYELCPKARGL